jgi:nucleoside-diphosphate-sugar epimerase
MRTVLISGGAGFIGSHLVDHFIKNGDRVVIVDNLYTGNMWNIQKYVGSDSFSFLRKDISTCTVNDFTRFKFDIVLHFASPASPIHYMKQPFMTMNANSKGTEFMLEIASRDHAKFLLASTSETYGDPEINPQAESYWGNVNCFGLRSCYDESKRFAETLAYLYAKQKRTDIRIVRIFNTYGIRMSMHDGRAVPQFIYQALNNTPITIFGDGSQTRSLCYVDDLVDGIIKLLESDVRVPVNLGNPNEIPIRNLAEIIKIICNSTSNYEFMPLLEDDPKQRCPDISRAKTLLNWEPKVDLEEGLLKTIEYFKKEMGA